MTRFTKDVLHQVRSIPPGETRTYGEVASAANHEGAAQAVGQVLSANPFPVIIPCHRVTRADGESSGYLGEDNISVKSYLLHLENVLR